MLTKLNEMSENRDGNWAFSTDLQTAVRAELEQMLKAPIFAQSSRCKRFLSHIVFETLEGKACHLKERTIGISVFDRPADYDTGDDSIVRVTANDVRKRIGQFYRESVTSHSIQIELPRGAYVPEFKIQPRRGKKTETVASETSKTAELESIACASHNSLSAPTNEADGPLPPTLISAESHLITTNRTRRRLFSVAAIAVVLASAVTAAALSMWRSRANSDAPHIWTAFSNANTPVLICLDTHDLHLPAQLAPDQQKLVDVSLYKQIVALDDAAVLSSMASVLGKKSIPFRVVGAEQTSLTEFRRQPVILIGAIDNKWTLRLTQNLRYRIEVANPPGSGSDKAPVASIVDSDHPETRWTLNLSVPLSALKSDYAIVAKVDDPTTGVPILIDAGLGDDGSIAASELLTSGALESSLAKEQGCQEKSNFEAVVRTNLIDTRPGPPHVIRLACW